MQETRTLLSFSSSTIASVVCPVVLPQRCAASRSSAFPLSRRRYTGFFALPDTTTASNPAFFIFQPKIPPLLALIAVSVSGEIVETSYRLPKGMPVPVRGPAAYTRTFLSLSGSIFGSTMSVRSRMPNPRPPIYSFLSPAGVGLIVTFPAERSA